MKARTVADRPPVNSSTIPRSGGGPGRGRVVSFHVPCERRRATKGREDVPHVKRDKIMVEKTTMVVTT